MEPAPSNWTRISATLAYQDADAAIGWLGKAFDFQLRRIVKDASGLVEHAELTFGDGIVVVMDERVAERTGSPLRSPRGLDRVVTQYLQVYVDDVQRVWSSAMAIRARFHRAMSFWDYGPTLWADKTLAVYDCDDHLWYFAERMRSPK